MHIVTNVGEERNISLREDMKAWRCKKLGENIGAETFGE